MVLMGQLTIVQNETVEVINEFKVVFGTPFGWTHNHSDALKLVLEKGLDPDTCIVPIVMAIGDTLSEIMTR